MGVGDEVAAVFLDRDGVLVREIVRDGRPYPPRDLGEFEIVADAQQALGRLKASGFLLIVVSNQPDVARGTQSREVVEAMNASLRARLPIDDVIVCFHDDADGCDCRKPQPGMILAAAQRHGIDVTRSFLIGDRWRDVEAGRRAGVRTIFIDHHYGERRPDPEADATVSKLVEAIDWIEAHPE